MSRNTLRSFPPNVALQLSDEADTHVDDLNGWVDPDPATDTVTRIRRFGMNRRSLVSKPPHVNVIHLYPIPESKVCWLD